MSLRMTWQDEDVPITTDQASRLCRRITTAGAGKVQKDVPDGDECSPDKQPDGNGGGDG